MCRVDILQQKRVRVSIACARSDCRHYFYVCHCANFAVSSYFLFRVKTGHIHITLNKFQQLKYPEVCALAIFVKHTASLSTPHIAYLSGYFIGARPASLAHKISYCRPDITTFGPLGAPGAHRFAFRWALVQILHSLKRKVFVMVVRTLFQRADLFPQKSRSCGDIQPLTAYPTIPQYRSVTQPQGRLAGIFRLPLIIRTPCGSRGFPFRRFRFISRLATTINMFLAQATAKPKPPSSCTI